MTVFQRLKGSWILPLIIFMTVMVVIDDRNGMLFNGRRQSQDGALRKKMTEIAGSAGLWMNRYSEKQFTGAQPGTIKADDRFMEIAPDDGFCFIENVSAAEHADRIDRIILFRWNRKYPGDFFFDIDLSDGVWTLASEEDFRGSSHEKISMEVYIR